jgi:hypothetical protein
MTIESNTSRKNDASRTRLGTNALFAVNSLNNSQDTSPEAIRRDSIRQRYTLQETAQFLLQHEPEGKRLLRCGVLPVHTYDKHGEKHYSDASVVIEKDTKTGYSRYANVAHCGSPWICPVCSAFETEKDRKEVNLACLAAAAKGWTVVMVTYTQKHERNMLLSELIDINKKSRRWLKSNTRFSAESWQDIKTKYGLVGGIINLECTVGKNGWHPHNHELIFIDPKKAQSDDMPELRWTIAKRWQVAVEKYGGTCDLIHGVDLRIGDSAVSEYIAKIGHEPVGKWSIESEMTKSGRKKGRGKGRTPFQLLYDYRFEKDKYAGELFKEFAKEFSGMAHIRWSQGLRDLLEMDTFEAPLTEADTIRQAESKPDYVPFVSIPREIWRSVVLARTGRRADLLLAAESGDIEVCELFARWHCDMPLNWYSTT